LFDNHKLADFAPYILKSTDAGKTWTSIKGDLPANGPVLAIAEDHVNPDLLFVGTEFGVFFTIDGGKKWIQMKGGLPTIAIRDIAIQKRENDLVLATFGRGFYILDDYSALRNIKPETFQNEAVTFPVKDAMMYMLAYPLGGSKKSTQGESFYTAPNPPFGATFTYFLKDELKTKKEIRQELEKEAEKNKQPIRYPSFDELRAEDEEIAPSIVLTITDSDGRIVRKLTSTNSKGINRVTWDLRYPSSVLASPPQPGSDDEPDSGPFVMPGKYTATLSKQVNGVVTQLGSPQIFSIFVPGQENMQTDDRKLLVDFQQKVSKLQRAVSGSLQFANDLKSRLSSIKRALQETAAPVDNLMQDALSIETRLNDILRNLRGDQALRSRNENSPLSINDRVNRILNEQSTSTARPTQTHQSTYKIAGEDFHTELKKLHSLVETDLAKLEKSMEQAGAPWTPGRLPDWQIE
jgi:hypothetical protein